MNEREVVQWILAIFAASYLLKVVVFAALTRIMVNQVSRSSLGRALMIHYGLLAVQSTGLAVIFAYYASRLFFGIEFEYWQRVVLYTIVTVLVLGTSINGVFLWRVVNRTIGRGGRV